MSSRSRWLASLAVLALLVAASCARPVVGIPYAGNLLGLVLLALDIYAIVKIVQSRTGTGAKVLWILLVLLFPVVGLILWALLGPK